MSISVNDKDLGLVTAYAYAVSKGYEGTEEEFAELMASYAETAETAVEAALKSEGHAIGEQDGVPVGSDSPYYHNNSKYYSEQAAGSATTASDKASEASGSASSASGSADSASANSLKSEGYAVGKQNGTDVESGSPYYHANAKYYSEQASADATHTGQDRTQTGLDVTAAAGSATAANASALKAEGYANGEQNGTPVGSGSPYYQNNAEYFAGLAGDSATAAAQSAEEAAASAGDYLKAFPHSTASGSLVTIPDGADDIPVKDLIVNIEPVQDLHGQSAPYPPGGGKNKLSPLVLQGYKNLNSGWTWVDNVASVNGITVEVLLKDGSPTGEYKITGTTTANTNFYLLRDEASGYAGMILNGIPSGTVSKWEMYLALQTSPYTSWGYDTGNGGTLSESASGMSVLILRLKNGATFNDTFRPMIRPSSVADGTFAPYSNVCPISGWTGVEVYQKGFNVWDEVWEYGGIDSSGNNVVADSRIRSSNYIPVIPDTDYYGAFVGVYTSGTWYTIHFYTENKEYIGYTSPSKNAIFHVPSNAHFMRFNTSDAWGSAVPYTGGICINISGSRNGEYEPYKGKPTIPIDWTDEAGTVYGGELNVTTGKLVVNTAKITFNGTETWGGTVSTFWCTKDSTTFPYKYASNVKAICNSYKYIGTRSGSYSNNLSNGEFLLYYNGQTSTVREIAFKDESYIGHSAWETALASNPIDVVFELETPIEYTLTPTQIATLLGTNNFWSNGNGQIDLEYRADTKLYIEQLTKPSEDDMTANANIVSGKFFMVGNRLMVSTTAIAQGEQIVVGTNCTEVSLADALNTINS